MRSNNQDDANQLGNLLNASGFAFQLAVEAVARAASSHTDWVVAAHEHPWEHPMGGGYIDLVLTTGAAYLAIECKRTRDATWMFLMPDAKQQRRSYARICWTNTVPQQRPLSRALAGAA